MIERKTTILFRKPVSQITDRAKRYRAHNAAVTPKGPALCGYCGSPGNKGKLDIEHINGDESDFAPDNLMKACRSCNVIKANVMRRRGLGKKTRQYNAGSKSELDSYGAAIKVMRGQFEGDVSKAVDIIRSTPPSVRAAYSRRAWAARRALYGPSGRADGGAVPF